MNIIELQAEEALKEGASLWILPSFSESPWTQKINGYVGFQVSAIEKKEPLEISRELKKIMDSSELLISQKNFLERNPLFLIGTADKIPAKWLIYVPLDFYESPQSWALKWLEASVKLKAPRTRIFLPESLSLKRLIMLVQTSAELLQNASSKNTFNTLDIEAVLAK